MLLHDATNRAPHIDPDQIADGDWVEDYLEISDVEPGKIWFECGVGPITVPRKASDLARPGWSTVHHRRQPCRTLAPDRGRPRLPLNLSRPICRRARRTQAWSYSTPGPWLAADPRRVLRARGSCGRRRDRWQRGPKRAICRFGFWTSRPGSRRTSITLVPRTRTSCLIGRLIPCRSPLPARARHVG
jgi:hypothetical protein